MPTAYEKITDQIISLMDQGVAPWRKPWKIIFPMNFESKREYHSTNLMLLMFADQPTPYWLTWNQIEKRKAHVRKGEHGMPIIYWGQFNPKQENAGVDTPVSKPKGFWKYYHVWNLAQVDGIDIPQFPDPPQGDLEPMAQGIVDRWVNKPSIRNDIARACYSPAKDVVAMPERKMFSTPEDYWHTLFHELIHSTGHKSRLHRFENDANIDVPTGEKYAYEELIAELGATMICWSIGMTPPSVQENAAAYLTFWKGKIKSDKRLFMSAAGNAQKAADFILGERESI
jgi:antirestriction protein ArdC